MKFQPYHIIHLDTAKQLPSTIDTGDGNSYVVIWWRNFPLGQLFLDSSKKLNRAKMLDAIFNSIWPALQNYDSKNLLEKTALLEIWHAENQLEWNNTLEKIFRQPEPPYNTSDVSVVICTRNRPEFLRSCLQLLQQQEFQPKEIIVVDNAPDDDGTKKVVESFPSVTYCLESTPGLDFARNAGAKKASGNIIAYTDDDAVLHPLWTYYIKQAFANPTIMGVTGLIIAAELQHEAQFLFEKYWSFNRGYCFKEYNQQYFAEHIEKGVPAWEIGAGANMAFRKEIFEKIGFFDERLDVGAAGCNGDSEYWYRILASGYNIQYSPLAIAYHTHRKDMQGLRKQIFYYMRGFTAALYIQHERFGHKGNMFHLYKTVFPYYIKILPKALRHRFRYNYTTYREELSGIFSGIRFYNKNKIAK